MRPLVSLIAIGFQLPEEVNMQDKRADVEKAQESLEKMRKSKGELPEFLEIMAQETPDVFLHHLESKDFAMHYTDLPDNCKVLICLAVSAALGMENMVESFIMSARKHEIPYEEIVHAILLARFVKSSTVFADSVAALKLLEKDQIVGMGTSYHTPEGKNGESL
jgi:alkylhydroperoxidase/carboxymuconolactone decarboxylase family protein YurZ